MSDHVQKTIDQVLGEIQKLADESTAKKKLVNQLCSLAGQAPRFTDADLQVQTGMATSVKRNTFYGRPISTCIREFLEMRKEAVPLDEIIAALKQGSFDLDAISKDEDAARRGVAITLGKNSQTFHRLPNDDWGLLAWYPAVREKKAKADDSNGAKQETPKPAPTAEPEPNVKPTEEVLR